MRRFVVELTKVDRSVENPFLNHVNLKNKNYYSEYIPERIAKFPRSETLKLENCSIQLDSNWDKTINSLKSLKKFDIEQCAISAEISREPWNLPVLKVLSFHYLDPESLLEVIFSIEIEILTAILSFLYSFFNRSLRNSNIAYHCFF
jgi:hypothetical protein